MYAAIEVNALCTQGNGERGGFEPRGSFHTLELRYLRLPVCLSLSLC